MEKKGSRSTQSSPKGVVTDSKKTPDVSGSKPWPRNGRRREPAGGSLSAKNDASRKPTPQRNKTFDKRPRPRGNYYSGTVCGKEDPGIDQQEAEWGSVFVQGSKKQSLNHLLNFHYAPLESQLSSRRPAVMTGRRLIGTQKHKYNKEQFLQANCQFVVNINGDYKQYMNNPDALVDWNLIEQVNVQVTEWPSCPICLYPPVAAKMTRCGHIYCWSCVLHYLALSDKAWRKCPICFEAVHKQDLKSVVAVVHPALNVTDEITFKLMKRQRGCLLAYPIDYNIPEYDILFNVSEAALANIHSKLLLADKPEIASIIQREKSELAAQLLEDENCPEKCFIEQAVALLKERENVVLNYVIIDDRKIDNKAEMSHLEEVAEELETEKLSVEGAACGVTEKVLEGDDPDSSLTANDLDVSISSNAQLPSKYFYFYQAADGQHIYLHALNVRMLEHTYGSLEKSPKILMGKIVEKEGGSMTEELRKRLRYLQHLPVTCQFEVAEIQLKHPVVSKETLNEFSEQIEVRRKRRQKRARDEKRREKRILEEENRKMGKYPSANIHIDSHHQFPDFAFEPVVGHERTESESTDRSASPIFSLSSSRGCEPASLASSLSNESEYTGMSFAKMLSSSKPRVNTWPELQQSSAAAATPVKLINVTGSKTSSSFARLKTKSESESDVDGYASAPAYNQSFGDAIAMALEKAALGNDDEDKGDIENGKKKKKKKNKGKVLFATSMPYSG